MRARLASIARRLRRLPGPGAAPRWLRRLLLGLCAAAVVPWLLWRIAVAFADFPEELLRESAAEALVVEDASGLVLREEASSAGLRGLVPLAEISPHLVLATLASEDRNFDRHAGVDWGALVRAAWLNLGRGRFEFGGSTITMQLVRQTARTRRSLPGKLRQMVLAARLERARSKREILEQYLNRAYYGNGAFGAEQAARRYFGKRAAELSLGEAAFLAVLPRGPRFYDPYRHFGRALARRDHILGLMEARGHIRAEERALAARAPIVLRASPRHFRAPHFVEHVKERLPAALRDAATVRTTLDWELQRRLEIALARHVDRLRWRNLTQSAIVVLRNDDGAILAMVGSRDYTDHGRRGAWNGATARLRPGSLLKPFVYGAALELGDTPATLAYDVVLPEDTHEFYTLDVRSHGFARYREALAGSYNLSAVHTLQRVGMQPALRALRAAGLGEGREDDAYDWGLAIGHAEARLLDLVAAFSTFGRGGRPIRPRAIELATTPAGASFREPALEGDRVFSEEVSYLVFDILRDPDARKPMFGDRVPMNLPFDVALKTGTTRAYTDLWAIGVTREFTVGVWAGNFDGSPTHQVMSVQGATPLLRAAYAAVAARYGDPTAPPRPRALVGAPICPFSGKRPGAACPHRKQELFVAGRLPTEECDLHRAGAVVYPEPVRGWAEHHGLVAAEPENEGPVRIVYPVSGARFVLDPHRPAERQRPPLAAVPSGDDLVWTIGGEPADRFVPAPGIHRIAVARGETVDEITVTYE